MLTYYKMIVWIGLVFVILLILMIIALSVLLTCQKENWTESLSELFEELLGRAVDPVSKSFYQNKNTVSIKSDLRVYASRVEQGKKICRTKSIIVAGLIRQCEDRVVELIKWHNHLKTCFNKVRFLIVENDSTDKTRSLLLAWALKDPSVEILCPYQKGVLNAASCSRDAPLLDKSPSKPRIERMAELRNLYLDRVREMEADLVLVMDLDLRGTLFLDGLFHTISLMENEPMIDAVACNGLLRTSCPLNKAGFTYYDSFAHVALDEPLVFPTLFDKRSHDDEVAWYTTKKYVEEGDLGLDRVRSAFGGACLYKKASIDNSRYGFSTSGFVCEHTMLHARMEHVYINPRMIFLIQENLN